MKKQIEQPVVKTSGFAKFKKGLGRQAHGICEIVAGFGDEIQGTLQMPLDAVNAINSKIESVKKVSNDIKTAVDAEMKEKAAKVAKKIKEQIKTVEGVIA